MLNITFLALYVGIALLLTKPNSIEGAAIAVVILVPVFFILNSLSLFWSRRFGGSQFMTAVFYLSFLGFNLFIYKSVLPFLDPFIGRYFG